MTEKFTEQFELVRLLGEGASGKVFLARDVITNEEVAIKVLDPSLAKESKFLERFQREAEVLRAFSHPGTIQLRAADVTEDGRHYLVMDYCRGRSLKVVLDEARRFTPERAIRITMELLTVLDAAHERGIVHRDIKPENIMVLEPDDRIQVLDFGVAKLKERSHTVTVEGAAVGTPQYMSPEQASGEGDIDARADIYAAGLILYELLAGAPPFLGRNMMHTLLMVLTQAVPPLPSAVQIPPSLNQALRKVLEKDREKRFQSAEEFLRALEIAYRDVRAGVHDIPALEVVAPALLLPSSGKTRIVCLDDQEVIINIMKHLLQHEGYDVITSTDWEVIHSFLFTNAVDLLVTDVEMPGMKGPAICQLLKKAMPELKVILFSNVPERELAKLAEESNADAWISKNTAPPQWLAGIKEVLSR